TRLPCCPCQPSGCQFFSSQTCQSRRGYLQISPAPDYLQLEKLVVSLYRLSLANLTKLTAESKKRPGRNPLLSTIPFTFNNIAFGLHPRKSPSDGQSRRILQSVNVVRRLKVNGVWKVMPIILRDF